MERIPFVHTKGKMEAYRKDLLRRIGELCGGGYTVVEAAELAPGLPTAETEAAIGALAAAELVAVSYAEAGVYCLALSGKGRAALECPVSTPKRGRGAAFRAALLFAAAFLGGLAGAALAVWAAGGTA